MPIDPAARDSSSPCAELSLKVQWACAVLVALEVGLVALALGVAHARPPVGLPRFWTAAAFTALAWLVAQWLNRRLVGCGPHRRRFALAPRAVNRPEFLVRLTFHVIINWSAIAAALIAGWVTGQAGIAAVLAPACIAASIAAWLHFNSLHRQVNRLGNLAVSSAFALGLIGASVALLLR